MSNLSFLATIRNNESRKPKLQEHVSIMHSWLITELKNHGDPPKLYEDINCSFYQNHDGLLKFY